VFFSTQAGKDGYAATLGLSLQEFGAIKGWTFLVQIPVFLVVGHFVDKFHPLRVAILGLVLTSLTYFACYCWVVDAPSMLLWSCLNNASIAIYLGAAMAMAPRLLPRERYGQFVSANLIFGITSLILAPPAIGLLMEYIRDYRYAYLFSGLSNVLALLACFALFRHWRKLGGDAGFTPPLPTTVQPRDPLAG